MGSRQSGQGERKLIEAFRTRCKRPDTRQRRIPQVLIINHEQDVFAILLAAHHPSLNLLGITTVHGNSSLANTTANAGSVLEAIGRPDIPVYPGSKKPFSRGAVHAPDIHGRYISVTGPIEQLLTRFLFAQDILVSMAQTSYLKQVSHLF